MGIGEISEIILGSVVISSFVNGIYTFRVNNRNIEIEKITEERKKWREEIRKLSIKFCTEKENRIIIRNELAMRLNPGKEKNGEYEDTKIIKLMDYIIKDKENDNKLKYYINSEEKTEKPPIELFILMIQWLLKHDWKRSKREAKSCIIKRKGGKRAIFNIQGIGY